MYLRLLKMIGEQVNKTHNFVTCVEWGESFLSRIKEFYLYKGRY